MAEDVGNLIVRLAWDSVSYDQGVKHIRSEMAVLKSEFKATGATVDGFGTDIERLTAKSGYLTAAIEKQQQIIEKYGQKLAAKQGNLEKTAAAHAELAQKVEAAKAAYEASAATLGENAEETQRLKGEYEKLSDEYEKNESKLRSNTTAVEKAGTQYNNAEAGLKALQSDLAKTSAELETQTNKWHQFGEKMTETGKKFKDIGKDMESAGKTLSLGITAPIVALGTAAIKASIDYESAFAGVRKTIDATEEEYSQLDQGLRKLTQTIPETGIALAGIAESAGQLGIAKEYVLDFTATIADISVATNLTAEQAASDMARFANIMSLPQTEFNKMGSAIVDLGNNFATTESEILDMSMRLAGAGDQAGMTGADVLGLATALTSVGIRAEAGGSAFSQLIAKMASASAAGTQANEVIAKTGMSLRDLQMLADSDAAGFKALAHDLGLTASELKNLMGESQALQDFAGVLGMTGDEFARTFNEDAAGAVTQFILNLAQMSDEGQSAIVTLKDMGLNGLRLQDSILRSASASDIFSGAMKTANRAWSENTALQNEANQRYATTESQMKLLKNDTAELGRAFGDIMVPILRDIVAGARDVIQWLSGLDDGTKKTIITIAGIAAAVGPVLIGTGKLITAIGAIQTGLGGMITKATTAVPAVGALGAANATAATSATALATAQTATGATAAGATPGVAALGVAETATGVAGAAAVPGVTALGAAINFLTGPIGLVLLAVTAVVGGFALLSSAANKVSDEVKAYGEEAKAAAKETRAVAESLKSCREEAEASRKEIVDQAKASKLLVKELDALASKSERTAGEQARMEQIISQLNKTVPGLALAWDKETNSLNKSIDAIKKSIQARKEQALLDAYLKRYTELILERDAAQRKLTVAANEYTEASNRLSKAMDENDAKGADRVRHSEKELQALANQKMSLAGAYNALRDELGMTDSELEFVEGKINSLAESTAVYNETADSQVDALDAVGTAADGAGASLEGMADSQREAGNVSKEVADNLKKNFDGVASSVSDAFGKIDTKGKALSFKDLNANLEANRQTAETWATNLARLADLGLNDGLLQQLREAGPESYAQVKKLAAELSKGDDAVADSFDKLSKTAQDKITALNENIALNAQAGVDAFKTAYQSSDLQGAVEALYGQIETGITSKLKPDNFAAAGASIPEGVAQGVQGGAAAATGAVEKLSTDVQETFAAGIDSHSPSKAFETIAESIPEGVAVGVENAMVTAVEAVTTLADALQRDFATEITALDFPTAGAAIPEGVAKGIAGGQSKAVTAAVNMAKASLKAAKAELGIASPSKKFEDEVGGETAEGWARGITVNEKKVTYALENLAGKSIKATKDWLKAHGDELKLSAAEEAAIWERQVETYKAGTKARAQADKEYADAKQKMQDAINKAEDEYQKKLESRTQQLTNFAGFFDEIVTKTVEKADLISALASQNNALSQWTQDIGALTQRGLDEGFMAELQALGPKSAAEVHAITQMTDEELGIYVGLWKEKQAIAREQAARELEGMRSDINSKIKAITGDVDSKLTDLAKTTKKTGEVTGQNYADGLNAKIPVVKGATSSTVAEVTGIIVPGMEQAGADSGAGIASGALSKRPEVYNAGYTLGKALEQGYKDAQSIASPSRVMQARGQQSGEGVQVGILTMLDVIRQAGYEMGEATEAGLMSSAKGIEAAAQNIAKIAAESLNAVAADNVYDIKTNAGRVRRGLDVLAMESAQTTNIYNQSSRQESTVQVIIQGPIYLNDKRQMEQFFEEMQRQFGTACRSRGA